jgi:hypothetical protein
VTWATLAIAAMLAARAPVPFEAEIDAAVAETAAVYPVPKALVIATRIASSNCSRCTRERQRDP